MKIDVMEDGTLCLREFYNSIILESAPGVQLAICCRDGRFEMREKDGKNEPWREWRVVPAPPVREPKDVPGTDRTVTPSTVAAYDYTDGYSRP